MLTAPSLNYRSVHLQLRPRLSVIDCVSEEGKAIGRVRLFPLYLLNQLAFDSDLVGHHCSSPSWDWKSRPYESRSKVDAKCVLCNGGVAVGFHCDVNRLATAGWARPRPAAAAESSACERGKAPPSATNGQDNSKILRATVQFNIC